MCASSWRRLQPPSLSCNRPKSRWRTKLPSNKVRFIVTELDSTSLYVMRRHKADALGHIYGVAPEVVAGAAEYFRRQLRHVALALADGRTYLMGDHFNSADILLVSAMSDGGAGLYVVPGDAPGLTRTRQDALDLTRPVAEVRLEGTPAAALGEPGGLEDLVDLACALLASEMVGGIEACLTMATAYAKTRLQFNRPIGSFQAVKHRLAEMVVGLDGARAAAMYAVHVADAGGPELGTVAPLAKAEAADAYTFAAGWNIQLLGGIGFTWEQDAHLYFRRAWTDSALYGGPAAQRARLADRIGL